MLNTCVYFVEVVNWVLTASTWVMFVQSIFVCRSEFFFQKNSKRQETLVFMLSAERIFVDKELRVDRELPTAPFGLTFKWCDFAITMSWWTFVYTKWTTLNWNAKKTPEITTQSTHHLMKDHQRFSVIAI